jgi:hypothetical protein
VSVHADPALLGYSPEELAEANRRAVALIEGLRTSNPDVPTVLNGVLGPRGDGVAAIAAACVR